MYKLFRNVFLTVAAAGLLQAAPVTFTGASGSLAASATFDVNPSGQLVIRLTNPATAMTLNPAMLLTAVYFDMDGANPVLTPVSAMMGAGSSIACSPYPACADTLPTGGDVGAEWAYSTKAAASGMPREFGISSTGLGLFGPTDNFGSGNLSGPLDVDGMQYGIATSNYNPSAAGVAGGLKAQPVIVGSVTFTLSGFSGYSLSSIKSVLFQYGTSLREPQIPGNPPPHGEVPEPATMGVMGAGLVGLALLRRRMK